MFVGRVEPSLMPIGEYGPESERHERYQRSDRAYSLSSSQNSVIVVPDATLLILKS